METSNGMSILDFVSEEELQDLDEDPRVAFMSLVSIARKSLRDKLKPYDQDDERNYHYIQDIRHSFFNCILAAAKTFEIEPFLSMDLPRRSKLSTDDFQDLSADLDHYVTQLMLHNSSRARNDSVSLTSESRDAISKYVNGLRDCITKSKLSDNRKKALQKKLDEFEKELRKNRMSYVSMARIVVEVLAVPGALWATGDVVGKLTNNIIHVVAQQRGSELETKKLDSPPEMKALLPPRKDYVSKENRKSNYDLDEDIPF